MTHSIQSKDLITLTSFFPVPHTLTKTLPKQNHIKTHKEILFTRPSQDLYKGEWCALRNRVFVHTEVQKARLNFSPNMDDMGQET